MMKQRLTPFLAAALLAAATPAVAARAGCEAKLDALDARIADARDAHAEDRVARLRAVRERVRHFCARGHGHASAAQVPPTAAGSTARPTGEASQTAARQPA
ncbi:hypothetical protein WT21_26430 [Burkholderia territorii]|uniref:Uncharacterized protein n=2 Tax=Burkholderia territorii TaxID=1503055 RepID=A0A118LFC8_9BURK|nr:DUF1090 family protein [Burkholderia territorii]AOI64728.1 hypothetical protein WS51_13720 [Burkholderia territorii]KUY86807.1 hypothetical protein WS47_25760 [Burkholderia territorii]KUZ09839.1 hypothetical protein WS50_20060 [Burkholderia territorii]KUZ27966.1 hypothetical protein WS52_27600 [Burkholderia territorii]KUZ44209.1 hypothetical protein WS53_30340 [Burkholderia territorii]